MSQQQSQEMLVYIIAGEPSGDNLGAKIMEGLRALSPVPVHFAGIGGEKMTEQGLNTLFPIAELSHIGFTEILPHIPNVFRRISQTVSEIKKLKPAVVITIDAPGFNFRVAKRLKGLGIKLVHYVAPTVWAYRPERANAVAELFDHIMVLLPFEPPYFEKSGIGCTFVGHPVVEGWDSSGNGVAFRKAHNIPEDAPLICVSPGSRPGEVRRHLPIFSDTIKLLHQRYPNLCAVIPTIATLAPQIAEEVAGWPVRTVVLDKHREKKDALAASNIALAKSGTVTLEMALAGVPTVVTYQVSPISAWLMRRMIMVRFVNLVNLISEKEVVPELLQEFCKPKLLCDAVTKLMESPEDCAKQVADARKALLRLGLGEKVTPSQKAAKVILEIIGLEAIEEKQTPKAETIAVVAKA